MTSGGQGGKRPGGIRARMSPLRVFAAVAAMGFAVMGFHGGLFASSSAEPTVQAFLLRWAQHHYRAAAALTTGKPAVVASELRGAFRQLHAAAFYLRMGPITQHPDTAEAYFYASVDLGQDGSPWNYRGKFTLRKSGSSWKVVWSPAVINPGLRPGLRLAVVTRMPPRAQLLDASGKSLQQPSQVYAVGIKPASLASPAATAAALGRATGLDPAQLLGQIVAAPRTEFLQMLTLSPASYARLRGKLSHVPGLVVKKETTRLFKSIASDVVGSVGTETSPVLRREGVSYHPGATVGLSGLQRVYQSTLAGTPTTEVVAEGPDGSRVSVLKSWPGHPSAPVRTTIDAGVQQAADGASAAAGTSAAVVAVKASTGQVLAVADHPGGGLPRIDPLAGRYPPGGAFTIVSAEAVLATGLPANATVRCTRSSDVGGQTFTNLPPVAPSARSTFATDFARGCGTAFAGLSRLLTPNALSSAASAFGIGSRWQLPLPAFSGSVPARKTAGGLAQIATGRGGVQVSPLGMAIVAADVDAGGWHPPSLTNDAAQNQATTPAALPAARVQVLRRLMRDTVRSGAASQADVAGQPVYGQAGVARMGKHRYATWFVGYRGDVAFAVLQLSKSHRNLAIPTATRFLRALPKG